MRQIRSSNILERALALHEAGQLDEAESLYRDVLAAEPAHPDALHYLGLVANDRGKPEAAIELIRRAIDQRSDRATYHLNLGNLLEAQGAVEAALAAYREAARLEPGATDAHFNVGLACLKLSRPTEAETSFRRVVELAPDDAGAYLNLGHTLRDQARWGDALTAYARARELRPGWIPAVNGWAYASRAAGYAAQACNAYRESLAKQPNDPVVLNNLGNALGDLGDRLGARDCYRRGIALAPERAELHLNLALTHRDVGEAELALRACRRAIALDSGLPGAWSTLASLIARLQPQRPNPGLDPGPDPGLLPGLDSDPDGGLEQEIIHCLQCDEVEPQSVARVAGEQIRRKYGLDARMANPSADYTRELVDALATDTLLLTLLRVAINVDAGLERVLIGLRRVLLDPPSRTGGAGRSRFALMGALALQCFANEFVYTATPGERQRVEALREWLVACDPSGLDPADEDTRLRLLRVALFYPLSEIESIEPLRQVGDERWGPDVAPVIARALREPLAERALRDNVAALAPLVDPVSRRVALQYEENPYPRWLRIPNDIRVGIGLSLRRRFPGFSPPDWLNAPPTALVAGCGTGYEPIELALREPRCRITGLDLSRTSLAYATRRAAEHQLSNLQFVHGDILDLDALAEAFSLISASGVLHHMQEPLVGWQRLADRLRVGGVMRIGLYSRIARRSIAVAREQISRDRLSPTAADIRGFRQRLLDGELSPGLGELSRSLDFYTLSGCRDLLFHVEEHDFDLSEIADCLQRLGLRFLGFEHPEPGVDERYARLFPTDPSRTSLANWARFEAANPATFVAMYRFWCQKI